MVVELPGTSARIILSADLEWCEVRIATDTRETELGADSPAILVERMIAALDSDFVSKPCGEIDGLSVGWVTTLSEKHTSIYVATLGPRRTLFFEDADGNTLARIDLDDDLRKDWLERLLAAQ